MADVEIPTPRGRLRGYLAQPAGDGPKPGVVVIHDILGMTRDLRSQANWLADAGYLAVAPDLYSWGMKLPCLVATFRDMRAGRGRAFEDIDATREWLVSREDCTNRVGIIGFCMGGSFALLAAAKQSFTASSVNYGEVPEDAETVLRGACPIVGSFGGRDRMLPGAAARLEGILDGLGVPHDIKEYPEAAHSFMNDHGTLFSALGVVMSARHHGPSADDARRRILAFFEHHLRS